MSKSDEPETGEPQYREIIETLRRQGVDKLGLMTGWAWHDDPRHLLFTLSRYKFVAKMMSGLDRVLEVGCSDAFATRLVAQEAKHIVAIDFDPKFIADATERASKRWPVDLRIHDILRAPLVEKFDGAYAMDVLEHIPKDKEDQFLKNICGSLRFDGRLIIGTPSLESQVYASQASKEGHVNCKSGPELQATLSRYFANVVVFSMNDEVIHTGYQKMSHYLIALCFGPLAMRSAQQRCG
jgi:2-polyprenyl-3-methyl-5-hydroxy-6-metoxy-1,4-benzoquinol methylase